MTSKPSQVIYIIGLVLLIVILGVVDSQGSKMDSFEYSREIFYMQDQVLASNEQQSRSYSYACGQMVSTESNPGEFVSIGNPAAEYCTALGHKYQTITHPDGSQDGSCTLPDRATCEAWGFLQGKCGQAHNACAQQGLQTLILSDGKNAFTREYAVCVDEDGEQLSSATDMVKLYSSSVSDRDFIQRGIIDKESKDPRTILHGEDSPSNIDALPSSFDWRIYNGSNWVTPVKNQGSCGSCWSFSAVGVAEAIYNIASHNPDLDLDLSEQYLVSDCHVYSGYQQCCGGYKGEALYYIRDSGVPDESCMSYIDGFLDGCSCDDGCDNCTYKTGDDCSDTTCSDRCGDWASRLTNITSVGYVLPNQADIKQALIDYGPLAVSYGFGDDYGGGFDNDGIYRCTSDTGTNHAVVMVGYNDAGGYWIIKNSWGTSYQDNGYFKLGYDECYIEQYVYYADVDDVPYPEISVAPGAFDETLLAGETVTRTLTISSTGTATLTWTIDEEPAATSISIPSGNNTISASNALSRESNLTLPDQSSQQVRSLNAATGLLNDGSFENGPPPWSAWTETSNTTCEGINDWSSVWDYGAIDGIYDFWAGGYCGDSFIPITNSISQTISVPHISPSLSLWYMSYRPSDDDPSPDDHVYLSVDGTEVWNMDLVQANDTYPNWISVTVDLEAYAGQNVDLELGAVSTGDLTGNVRFDLIDWDTCSSPQDIPWLSLSPIGGTTPPDNFTPVDVIIDSVGLAEGTYSGNLCINSNDPITPLVVVPVTLDVEPYRVYIPLIIR